MYYSLNEKEFLFKFQLLSEIFAFFDKGTWRVHGTGCQERFFKLYFSNRFSRGSNFNIS